MISFAIMTNLECRLEQRDIPIKGKTPSNLKSDRKNFDGMVPCLDKVKQL